MSRPRKLLIFGSFLSVAVVGDAGEQHGDALVVGDVARCAQREQAGEARRARVVDVDARSSRGRARWRCASVSSSTTTALPPVASIPSTTASQS